MTDVVQMQHIFNF